MGDIYLTTTPTNPSSIYLGTTWQKIENRFLLGTSSNVTTKQLGGSNTILIKKENLPKINLKINSFSVTTLPHEHLPWIVSSDGSYNSINGFGNPGNPAIGGEPSGTHEYKNLNSSGTKIIKESGSGTTSTASPLTELLGNSQSLDITPSYYTCHMWLRIS